ncbi:MAG: four helix bundle protein [Patescibacteria group bacterium]|mgnify:CR=1 FL=1
MEIYRLWDEFKNHFTKKHKYTLGGKIDQYFLDTIELLFVASYLSKEQKIPYLKKSGIKLDLLKFLLQISWELKVLDNKKYITLSGKLEEIGKMLGGWVKGIQKETPLK